MPCSFIGAPDSLRCQIASSELMLVWSLHANCCCDWSCYHVAKFDEVDFDVLIKRKTLDVYY